MSKTKQCVHLAEDGIVDCTVTIRATPNSSVLEGLAHELWAAAQLLPHEGIEDAIPRLVEILQQAQTDTVLP